MKEKGFILFNFWDICFLMRIVVLEIWEVKFYKEDKWLYNFVMVFVLNGF